MPGNKTDYSYSKEYGVFPTSTDFMQMSSLKVLCLTTNDVSMIETLNYSQQNNNAIIYGKGYLLFL